MIFREDPNNSRQTGGEAFFLPQITYGRKESLVGRGTRTTTRVEGGEMKQQTPEGVGHEGAVSIGYRAMTNKSQHDMRGKGFSGWQETGLILLRSGFCKR